MAKVSGPVPRNKFFGLACQIRKAPVQTIFLILPDSVPPVSKAGPVGGRVGDLIIKSRTGLGISNISTATTKIKRDTPLRIILFGRVKG